MLEYSSLATSASLTCRWAGRRREHSRSVDGQLRDFCRRYLWIQGSLDRLLVGGSAPITHSMSSAAHGESRATTRSPACRCARRTRCASRAPCGEARDEGAGSLASARRTRLRRSGVSAVRRVPTCSYTPTLIGIAAHGGGGSEQSWRRGVSGRRGACARSATPPKRGLVVQTKKSGGSFKIVREVASRPGAGHGPAGLRSDPSQCCGRTATLSTRRTGQGAPSAVAPGSGPRDRLRAPSSGSELTGCRFR